MKPKLNHFINLCLSLALAAGCTTDKSTGNGDVAYWITTGDKTFLLKKGTETLRFTHVVTTDPVIEIDTAQRFQTIDGFGYALTGGSAYLINQKMNEAQQEALLRELFLSDGNNIGISYLRISIGASDLDDHVYTYDDMPIGKIDTALDHFNLEEDQKNLIPVLKKIVAMNPEIKIMGSPWSAPAWMKTNNSPKGGSLKPEYYEAYARYLVKYIQGMALKGIAIDAITLQNEPENPKNNPSALQNDKRILKKGNKVMAHIFLSRKRRARIL